jgi:hypothetical protein
MALTVTDAIPYGNVCDVDIIQQGDLCQVSFAASAHGGPESLWFCFRIQAQAEEPHPSHLRVVLKHVNSMLGCGSPEVIRPVVRRDGGDWSRLGQGIVETAEDGRVTVEWEMDAPAGAVDIAFCYLYGVPEVEALVRDAGGYWQAESIGVSQGDRPIVRLSNHHTGFAADRPCMLFVARQHSGETPGSWVLDGLLRELAGCDDAPLVWAVPLSNIDGVEQGDYGKDNFPYDLNRAWGVPMRHETLVMQRDIRGWAERCTPLLGVDFHGPGGTENDGAYAFLPKPEQFPQLHEQTRQWTERIRTALGEYAAPKFSRVASYASRWKTPNFTHYCAEQLGIPAFSLETPYSMVGDLLLHREQYREIGGRMARALVELCGEGCAG